MSLNILVILLSLIFCLILMPIGIIVCKKLYNNIKDEEHLEKGKIIQRIMKTYSFAQCVFWPNLIIFSGIIYFNNHFLKLVEPSLSWYAIHVLRCMCHVFRIYVSFNSLIVAISRYIFIIYKKQVETFGIKKIKYLLVSSSIIVPIFHLILYEATFPIEPAWISVFASESNSTIDTPENEDTVLNEKGLMENYNFLLYILTIEYFYPAIVYAIQMLCYVMVVVICTNLIEGFIYLHIFIHFRR